MTENPASASTTKPLLEDVLETFTGWDEIAIGQHFGEKDWTDLTGTMLGRAAVFVMRRHGGMHDGEAHKVAMGLTLGELKASFADDDLDAAAVDKSLADAAASGDIDAVIAATARAESRPEA